MKVLVIGLAALLAGASIASAQTAPRVRTAGINGTVSTSATLVHASETEGARARSDDDRLAEGALGRARLAQDSVQTESETRERLAETLDDTDSLNGILAEGEPRIGSRAALMRDREDN